MAYRYKRFYLWGSVSLVAIFALIAPFIQYYYGYDEITYCGEKCFVTFCLKNGNKNLYFYNKDELPLTFYPEDSVSNVEFFKKDGRYKSGYRPINFIDPYYKDLLYVFKISAYLTSCYAMEIEKEWWADVKWTFGELDPMLISGVEVGGKIVKEMCNPIFKTVNEKTTYYKKCDKVCDSKNLSCTPYQYDCIDYIEDINVYKQVDCIKTGKINVSGKIYSGSDSFCKLIENKICCAHNKEGGQFATERDDGSVTKCCKDLITGEEICYNSLKVGKSEVIKIEI